MQSLFFYKNKNIRWRWENDEEIIIYFNDSQFCRLNKTASLIFLNCDGVNLSYLCSLFKEPAGISKKNIFLKVSEFLRLFINKKIIISKSNSIPRFKQEVSNENSFYFEEPSAKFFDIGNIGYLSFIRPKSPLRVFFTISETCNLKCKHCYNVNDKQKDITTKIDLNKIRCIIDKLNEAEVFKIILTGGEPFLNPHIFDIIDYIQSKDIKVRINTNALLLSDWHIEELKKREGVILTLGIDGISADTHDFIRGEGTFKNVLYILEKLSQEGFDLYINFTATRINLFDILRLKRFFKNFRVKRIIVNIFIRTGSGYNHREILSLNKLQHASLASFAHFSNKDIRHPIITTITSCYAGHIESYIDYKGNVFFCDLLHRPIGNILENGLKEIWNSEKLLNLNNPDLFGFPCNICLFRKNCKGSCRAEVFFKTGDIYAGNPYCIRGKLYNLIKNFYAVKS